MKKISLIIPILVVFLLSGCGVDTIQCTKEGKVCEDGTVLSREGINCEFPECPKLDIIQEEYYLSRFAHILILRKLIF